MHAEKQVRDTPSRMFRQPEGKSTQQFRLKNNRECEIAHKQLIQGMLIKRASPSINRNLVVQQRRGKRFIQTQRKNILQCQTNMNFTPMEMEFQDAKEIVGKTMTAHLDPDDPVIGSEPGTNEQKELMDSINDFFKGETFIRGHLLNADLGGPGLKYNLFPISSKANHAHSLLVEEPLKMALAHARYLNKDIEYNVSVDINSNKCVGNEGELCTCFNCSAEYVDKDAAPITPIDNSIIPKTEIFSNVTRKKYANRRESEIYRTVNESASESNHLEEWGHKGKGHTKNIKSYESDGRYLIGQNTYIPQQTDVDVVEDEIENSKRKCSKSAFAMLLNNYSDELLDSIIPYIPLEEEAGKNIRLLNCINGQNLAASYLMNCLETGSSDLTEFMNAEGEKANEVALSTALDDEDATNYDLILEGIILNRIRENKEEIMKRLDINESENLLENSDLKSQFFSIIKELFFPD